MGEANGIVGRIERELAGFAGTVELAAKHLGTGEEIRIAADRIMPTASTIKAPILIELFRRVERGEVDLGQRLVGTAEATKAVGSD